MEYVEGFNKYGNETLSFHKVRVISWLAERLLASEEEHSSMELDIFYPKYSE